MTLLCSDKMEAEFLRSATSFVSFLKRSCSCFHVVKNCCEDLTSAGFQRLSEKTNWSSAIKPCGKYFITRNESAVVAFAIGGQYKSGNGFSIVAAHTDSPYLKLKPVSKIESNGYCQLGVETYGGGIWSSSLAIHLRDSDAKKDNAVNKETSLRPITHMQGTDVEEE